VEDPLLVVEVLSPSTAQRDRVVKRRIYLDAGVEEVWIVDLDAEKIEVYARGGASEFSLDETARSAAVPGFALSPRDALWE
jgi:Uma2 family endonuclease